MSRMRNELSATVSSLTAVQTVFLLGLALASGCSMSNPLSPPKHLYGGPERPIEELATVHFSLRLHNSGLLFVAPQKVDGRLVQDWPKRLTPQTIYLKPGKRLLRLRWHVPNRRKPVSVFTTRISFVVEAGKSYIVAPTPSKKKYKHTVLVIRDGKIEDVPIKREKRKWVGLAGLEPAVIPSGWTLDRSLGSDEWAIMGPEELQLRLGIAAKFMLDEKGKDESKSGK